MIIDGEVNLINDIEGTPDNVILLDFDRIAGYVVLREDLGNIPAHAFQNRTDLLNVVNQGPVTVGDSAFEGCTNLQYVSDFSQITAIGERAFKDCSSLTEITLKADGIEDRAFEGCSSLVSVTLDYWHIEAGDLIFGPVEELPEGFTIYVDPEDLPYYEVAPGWETYKDYME